MKGVHRKGHQRAYCLLCRSFPLSLIMSSLQSYYCTSWLHLSFTLSLGLSTLFSLVGGLLREPQPPAAVTLLSLYWFLCFTLSWVPTMPSGSVLTPFQGICWRLNFSLSTGSLTKACHQLLAGLTIRYFVFGRCHSYFSCANLAQAIFGKYLSAAWNFASLFLQIICGSLPHFLLNAELKKIRFSINFP